MARAAAVEEGFDPHTELLQELGATTRSFRAGAVLRRQAELAAETTGAVAEPPQLALWAELELPLGRDLCDAGAAPDLQDVAEDRGGLPLFASRLPFASARKPQFSCTGTADAARKCARKNKSCFVGLDRDRR